MFLNSDLILTKIRGHVNRIMHTKILGNADQIKSISWKVCWNSIGRRCIEG